MLTTHTIARLNQILDNLLAQAQTIDAYNKQDKAFSFRKDQTLFSEALFNCQSEWLVPYVKETQSKVTELSTLLLHQKHHFSLARLHSVEHQISALINAIKSYQVLNKASAKQAQVNQQKKYRKAVESMMESSQALHQKLAETFGFERRLQAMLNEKQLELAHASQQQQKLITEQVLVLHQRLGRCRQAISKLERQIEMSEKR